MIEGIEIATNPDKADVIIIHEQPSDYPQIFLDFPILKKKYTIAYAVWETDILPKIYAKNLILVNEIWTCSDYALGTLKKYFRNVYKIPHVVPKHNVKNNMLNRVKRRINYNDDKYFFYTIVNSADPRKNLPAMLEAFNKFHETLDGHAFFIVKQYGQSLRKLNFSKFIIPINEVMDDMEIQALHAVCDCYISAHCSEAWGLSISDAMAWGNMVIATGYSGNMEYMDMGNSYPIKYKIKHIKEEALLFSSILTREMKWAYIDIKDMVAKMRTCYRMGEDQERSDKAQRITSLYSHRRVARCMKKRLSHCILSN